ncbi:unnamed protein product [Bursaphelenchus xylophilus]|uniref:(pine wood nematode) hypothetical protein n=1 Tax=Bursaphelenchus xylophilus TaxID=6326 RepID=A0A1I7S5H1_BURXY|nr:unnamed protein product [Bursaphelenchus xylophilus]CAG9124702.1 unnamed protein product [Bursaphelenchus xylophilus]
MDLYFRRPEEYLLNYNCSFYDTSTWPVEGRRSLSFALGYLVAGIVEEILYIPVIYVLMDKKLRHLFCYRMMLILAIYDVLLLPVTAFATAYFSYTGAVFCEHPTVIYFMGIWLYSMWMGYSVYATILALNRCVCFTRANFLFKGYWQYFWYTVPLLYTIYEAVYGRPVIFNAQFCGWFFNPHMGYYDDLEGNYVNYVHMIDNSLVALLIPTFYVLFYVCLKNLMTQRNGASKREKNLFITVFGVSMMLSIGALGYVMMQLFKMPTWVILISHVIWLIVQGAPPVIYLTLNQTFKSRIFHRRITSSTHSSAGNDPTKNNKSQINPL